MANLESDTGNVLMGDVPCPLNNGRSQPAFHRPPHRTRLMLVALRVVCLLLCANSAAGADDIAASFTSTLQPILIRICGDCHGQQPIDNDLNLIRFDTAQAFLAKPKILSDVAERVRLGDMPPREAPQPTPDERRQILAWITAALDAEAALRAGDPGPVALRRLSNTAYDNAIRDLTGVDLRPTSVREFPVDSVGGEGFANVGDAMPVTPELIERFHQTARDVAARAVLLPAGFRFSPSTERPDWTEETLKPLRSFHARFAGPNGEPPLAAHLAATLKHRDRLNRGGAAEIAAVAAAEQLNATYLAALWSGLNGQSAASAEILSRTKQWVEQAAVAEAEKQRRQAAFEVATKAMETGWVASKRLLTEAKVPEAGSVSFESSVAVQRGELLLLTVLPNDSHGADSTLVELTIRETGGEQRTWRLADLVPFLLKGNPWLDKHDARWSFLEATSAPRFLTDRRDSNGGRSELKSWSLGSEPSVFVNSGVEPVQVWTTLPGQSFFVHPGPKRNAAIAWTSPLAGELRVSGRVADAHSSGGDGVSFELSHVAAAELGPALSDLGSTVAVLPDPGLPPDPMALIQETWRAATTDPAPVLAAIRSMQDLLFQGNYRKNAALAVGNGFPAWEDTRRIVARERVQGVAREPLFRMVSLPAQADAFVIWDRLRLEGGDGPPLVFAEHPELGPAIEQAAGLKFGQHPLGRAVPASALVTAAGAEIVMDLGKLPAELQTALTLPRFLRADVSLDEASPETAAVQAFLIAAKGGGGNLAEPVAKATPGDPLAAEIVHHRVVAERARPAAEFRALFPPAVLFQPIIPRDAQGSVFLYRREDEPLRRLLLDDAGRAEINRLWSELDFVSEQALATPIACAGLVQYYRKPNDGARIMFFFIQEFEERIQREKAAFLAAQVAAEPRHLDALLTFAARAWRRSLTPEERAAILSSYQADRKDGIRHDPAFRAALARVLSSPWFLYRVEQPAAGPRWQPVSGDELATRLSFLLWDSIPDEELRAASAQLHDPLVMEQQLRRMLKDQRIRGMAAEFGSRWLGVRDFVTSHGRNLQQFPEFTSVLRDALAEEPVRFFEDLLRNDRPVPDIISADAVVINDVLARHYGIPGVTGGDWRRVENVASSGRGGFLGFGAVIAKQSAASRTSPIKRGAWLLQMLGERLPKVPPDVPPLPETPPPGLSVREITERHRQDPKCAGCHDRIDPFGMALERFDAIGRLRPASELKPGDTTGKLRDGTEINDIAGLRNYFAGPRREDLLRTLARKLTGYALGRAVITSDRSLVDKVTRTMVEGGRWSDALLVLVRSEQFRCIRSADTIVAP